MQSYDGSSLYPELRFVHAEALTMCWKTAQTTGAFAYMPHADARIILRYLFRAGRVAKARNNRWSRM